MGDEYHAAALICDAIVWGGSNIIKELVNGNRGVFGGGLLLGTDGSEGNKELAVHGRA